MGQAEKLVVNSRYIGFCWIYIEIETVSAVSLGKGSAEYSEKSHSSLAARGCGQFASFRALLCETVGGNS